MNKRLLIIITLVFSSLLFLSPSWAADEKKEKWEQGSKLFKDGQNFFYNSLFDKARESFEEALKLFKELEEKESIAAVQSNLGAVYKHLRDYHKSIEYYQDARDSYRDLKDKAAIAACFSQLGTVHSLRGDYDQALSYFNDALEVWIELAKKDNQAAEHSNLGTVYCNTEKYPQAIAAHQKALAIRQEMADRAGEGKCLTDLGLAYSGKGDYLQALDFYQKARDICRELQDKKGEATNLTYSGASHFNQGDYVQALSYYQKALEIDREIGDKAAEGATLTDMALTNSNQGDFDQALLHYQEALLVKQETDDARGEGTCQSELGMMYANLGNYAQAVAAYQEALEIKKELNDKQGEGRGLTYLGNIYVALGDYNKALGLYQKALAIQEEIREQADELVNLTAIGDIYFNQEDYEKALTYYQKAWLIRQELEDYSDYFYNGEWIEDLSHYHWRRWPHIEMEFGRKIGMSKELNMLGEIYKNQADYFHSLAYYDKARAFFLHLGIPFAFSLDNLGNTYLALGQYEQALDIFIKQDNPINLGRYYLIMKDYKAAKHHFSRRQDKFVEMRMDDFALAGWIGLGLACEGLGEFEVAKVYYLKAADALEQQQETLPAISHRYFLRGKAIHLPRLEAYEGMVRMLVKLGDEQGAFTWAEKSRAALLAEQLPGGQTHIPADLAAKELDLIKKTASNYKQQKVVLQKGNKTLLEYLIKEGQKLREQKTALIEQLRREFPRYAALRYPQPIQAGKVLLKQKEIVIEYEVTEPYTICFVINDSNLLKTIVIPQTRQQLREMVTNLRRFLNDKADYNFQAAHGLYNMLLKKALGGFSPGSPLIIIPDEMLSLLPFEALVINGVETEAAEGNTPPIEKQPPKRVIPPDSGQLKNPPKQETKLLIWPANEMVVEYKQNKEMLTCLVYLDGKLHETRQINKPELAGISANLNVAQGLSPAGSRNICAQSGADLKVCTTDKCLKLALMELAEEERCHLLLGDILADMPPFCSLLIIPDGDLNLLPLENWALDALNRQTVAANPVALQAVYQLAQVSKEEVFIEYEVGEKQTKCLVFVGEKLKKSVTVQRKRSELKEMVRRIRPLIEPWKNTGKIDVKLGRELYDLFLKDALTEIPVGSPFVIIPDELLEPIPFETLAKFFWAQASPQPEAVEKPAAEVAIIPEKPQMPKPEIVVKKEARSPNEVVVEYEAKDDHVVCTVEIGGKLEKTITIAKTRTELEKLIHRAGSEGNAIDLKLGLELYNLFLKKALSGIPSGSTLVIMLDNFLSRLPFEALAQNFAGKKLPSALLDTDLNATIEYEVEDAQTICTIDWEGAVQKTVVIPKTRKEFAKLIKTFPSPLEPGNYADKFSQELKDQLFDIFLKEPLSIIPQEKGIIIIADEFLSLVPFEALLRNIGRQKKIAARPEYLGEYWPCSYHQSASQLTLNRQMPLKKSAAEGFLMVGDAVYDQQDSRLKEQPDLTHERGELIPSLDLAHEIGQKQVGYNFLRLNQSRPLMDDLGKLYADNKLLADMEAAEELFKKQDLSQYRYIVLAVHGLLGNDLPYIQEPALALTLAGSGEDDGFLSADEILDLKLDAELVTLPACQIGKQPQNSYDGIHNLSCALIFSGCDAVLGSLWTSDNEFTTKFLLKFFEGVKSGQSRLDALQNAKLYMLNNGYADPYYWAGFVLTGETK
ncbi:MAG: tetratricopeptide repeat protein [Candidatus Schekmanbacteria bacterium]|nr:tetratricopeptide repeat protein [Candidatus Schekmanbacteria bacterium]